ncbi:Cycloartenol synthase [Turnera subulata]|uniref:Terpene cyclase/mutase family member n=1 Tax=Turnera subulata TaxID=218843 RepID=A0A9Q0JEP8_9ROSI|nr:Cycloartenol synthase [Turnera subulata]
MWKLKVAEGGSPWLRTTNSHVGRQVWEFDPKLGSPEELADVENARRHFHENRFHQKHSADLIMRLQFAKENGAATTASESSPGVTRVKDSEEVTEEMVTSTLRKAMNFYSTIQAHDGHWPGDYGGPMFLMPGLVITLSITGALHAVLSEEHIREMCRYLYNHQMGDGDYISRARAPCLGEPTMGMEQWRGAVLGAFEWSGNNPLPPEIWLLPYMLPVHPVPYHEIDWNQARNLCAKEDLYYPHPLVQDVLWAFLDKAVEPILMRWPGKKLREKALRTVMEHIHYEDENTRYICIGPVNKVLNMLCCWVEDPNSEAFKLHLPRINDYLWLAEDGMKMQGYNGSQLWDTAFAVQAIISTKLVDEYGPTLRKAHSYVLEDCPGDLNYWYRHISKGAWPFSTADHGWPISDCTAEGLKAALLLSKIPSEVVGEPLTANRFYDAVNVILSLQNGDGGFATYELTRSYSWLELINPAETFGDIVIDYPYVECTSAAIQALTSFKNLYPGHRREEIEHCIRKAATFIEKIQEADGSWYGSWAVCFTYGTWFGIKGLVAAGKNFSNCSSIQKACDFLLSKQCASGGWGESYLSCQDKVYSNLEGNRSHVVNTAWAMLALIDAGQEIMGVFNRNCMITYAAYRDIFPIWALGEYRTRVLQDL